MREKVKKNKIHEPIEQGVIIRSFTEGEKHESLLGTYCLLAVTYGTRCALWRVLLVRAQPATQGQRNQYSIPRQSSSGQTASQKNKCWFRNTRSFTNASTTTEINVFATACFVLPNGGALVLAVFVCSVECVVMVFSDVDTILWLVSLDFQRSYPSRSLAASFPLSYLASCDITEYNISDIVSIFANVSQYFSDIVCRRFFSRYPSLLHRVCNGTAHYPSLGCLQVGSNA